MTKDQNGKAVDEVAEMSRVDVSIPVCEDKVLGYLPLHIQTHVDARQGAGLKRVWIELDRAEAKLASGKRVASYADTVRYILEQIPG